MTRRSHGSPLVALVLGTLLAIASAVGPQALAPVAPSAVRPLLAALDAPVAQAADGLGITTRARYVVVPDDAVVRVTVDIEAANSKTDATVGGATTRYYYDGVNLGVQPEARNLRATQDGAQVPVAVAARQGYRLVTISFRSSIFLGETAKLRLLYDLPAGKPRSSSDVRVGPAFASFLAWAFGDSGTVRIEIPKAFKVDVSGSEMTRATRDDGTQVYKATTDAPLTWYAWVNARNDDGLTRTRIALPGSDIVLIRAWPEDARWQRRVTRLLTDGIPELTTRIGLPWPVDGALSVLEIHTPLLEGYAGFYNPETDEITISEDLDDATIVHEASHAWFNQRLFTERWITEGLAETYASQVVDALGGDAPSPRRVAPDDAAAFPLNDWPGPSPIKDDDANAKEQYGYDASFLVIDRIATAAGTDGMQKIFAAADAGTTAYTGETQPEKTTLPDNDWRRFLDLAEEQAGVPEVASLLRTWALTSEESRALVARESARDAYAGLAADADGWAAPVGVRLAMDGWRFDEAKDGISAAETVLERRATIEDLADDAGLEPPRELEIRYETAADADALGGVARTAAETEAALKTVIAATEAASGERDWLTELGLSGKDPDADLAAARTAWEAGSFAEATTLATTAAATLAVAPDAGRGRALVAGAAVGLVLLLVVVVLTARRRSTGRRRAAVELAAEAPPSVEPPPPPPPPPTA